MKFPPEPKTPYVLDKEKYRVIFEKLKKFEDKKLSKEDEELVKFLYSQMEENWETPLEKFIDKLFGTLQTL
jgi:hypothetical protein